jgi:hypothetical protein
MSLKKLLYRLPVNLKTLKNKSKNFGRLKVIRDRKKIRMLNLLKTRYKSIVDKIKKIHYEKIKISKKPVIKNKKSLKISNKKKQTNKKAKKKLLLKI